MQMPIQSTFPDVPRSDALEAHIRQKAEKLEEFHSRITSCRVTVEEMHKHHHQGRHFRVRIDLRVPGKEIVANRDHHEDVYVALRDAFDAVKRQLEEVAREMRGDVKAHVVSQHGKVARLFTDEGYGFIETADGRELYFSRENVVHPTFDQLTPGSEVQFIEEMAAEGPQAKRISVGKHHA
jgi:ribosomal subunit interface protein